LYPDYWLTWFRWIENYWKKLPPVSKRLKQVFERRVNG